MTILHFPSFVKSRATVAIAAVLLVHGTTIAGQTSPDTRPEFNTLMMESTFMLEGRQADGQIVYGTSFILGRPFKADPTRGAFVLVTAKHVLEPMIGETATLVFRVKNERGHWQKTPWSLRIREGARPLWKSHPNADVVALYVRLPKDADFKPLATTLLAGDELLKEIEIHAGDEVNCLGFPFRMQSNDAGFPVLRSGKIASHPLLPANLVRTFLMDFSVLPGNSGGPVFLVSHDRAYGGAVHIGQTRFMIVGLVIQERYFPERVTERAGISERRIYMNLAEVVHAALIKELVELLPEPTVQ